MYLGVFGAQFTWCHSRRGLGEALHPILAANEGEIRSSGEMLL